MSSVSPDFASRTPNPIFMPMVIVSSVAVLEAVAVVILLAMLARQGPSPAPPVCSPSVAAAADRTPSYDRAHTEAHGTLPWAFSVLAAPRVLVRPQGNRILP